MIFNRISYRLALQFTAFVFFLFLVNGAIFLMADIRHAHNEAAARLDRSLSTILSNLEAGPLNPHALPPWLPDRVRISDPLGRTVYAGRLFVGLPPSKGKGSVIRTRSGSHGGSACGFNGPASRLHKIVDNERSSRAAASLCA
jgi:hypothetical protein